MIAKNKTIYVRVTEDEHKAFKIFATQSNMTIQEFVKNACKFFIRETQKIKSKKGTEA